MDIHDYLWTSIIQFYMYKGIHNLIIDIHNWKVEYPYLDIEIYNLRQLWISMLIMDIHDWIVDIYIWIWISRIHNNCRYPWFSYGNNYGYICQLI